MCRSIPVEQRFWDKVDVRGPDECWTWTRAKRNGYGVIAVRAGHVEYAHRLSARWAHGPCPEGQQVMHSCDNPACVNPAHLSYGTAADNQADMRAKGRGWVDPGLPHPPCTVCGRTCRHHRRRFCSRSCAMSFRHAALRECRP